MDSEQLDRLVEYLSQQAAKDGSTFMLVRAAELHGGVEESLYIAAPAGAVRSATIELVERILDDRMIEALQTLANMMGFCCLYHMCKGIVSALDADDAPDLHNQVDVVLDKTTSIDADPLAIFRNAIDEFDR